MTKKDYELIAKAIADTNARINREAAVTDHPNHPQLRGVRRTAAHLADALAADNPRFDMQRFLTACGYGV